MKKLISLLIFLLLPITVLAEDITKDTSILINAKTNSKITDNNENSYVSISKNEEINIKGSNINALYIIYELKSQKGTIYYNDKEQKIGQNNFLHEYIKLENKTDILTVKYNEDVKIGEIYILSEGELPSYVEKWMPPCDKADLLLFSTHSDDEQLFFLGLLPTYVAKGANVEVVYFTNHYDNPKRLHEQLHGLYAVGIRNYPIIGIVPDAWSETLDGAQKNMEKKDITMDMAMTYQVENIRRFKPLVIVGHDEKGEYSHGQHILNTYLLKDAITKANDDSYDKNSLDLYGLWDTPKLYLHLYKENQIKMDYDTPLEYFNGKTAYEVSKIGYSKHTSQQWTWFTAWINGKNNEYTKATDIKTYAPTDFGLYRSLVGEDINKNDMFENLTLRKDEVQEDVKTDEEQTANKKDKIKKNNYILPITLISVSVISLIVILIFKRK